MMEQGEREIEMFPRRVRTVELHSGDDLEEIVDTSVVFSALL